jgi:RNA polymerase sigma-70 factor (ECF subfamily)
MRTALSISEKVFDSMTVDKSANQPQPSTTDEVMLIRLYEQYRRPIHSYINRLLGNSDDADDITQEVFIRAVTSWDRLEERDNLSAWLYRIATNLCVDALRRRKRIAWWPWSQWSQRRRQDDDYGEAYGDDLTGLLSDEGGIYQVAERDSIRETLAKLPDEYAVVLILNAAQGVPYQEVAQIVGISPNAAATRISRAKKMFAKEYISLNKDGVEKRGKRK